jgi:hypothetical protein
VKLKYFLIGGLGFMLTGGILAVSSYKFGTLKSFTWDNGPKLIDMAQDFQTIPSTEKIKKIIIHAEHQQVQITRGLDFEVQTSYEKAYKPQVSVDGQTLSIEANAKERNVWISLEDNTPSITLTIPKDLSLSEIKIEGDDSYFGLTELASEKITTKTYGGTLLLDSIEGKSAKIEDMQGNVTINHSTIQKMAVTGRNSRFYLEDLTHKQSAIEVENSSIDLFSKNELGLDIQLSGSSTVTKDNENLALKTVLDGKDNLKITGYDSNVNIYHEEENMEDY